VNAFASGVEETYHAAVRQHLLLLCLSKEEEEAEKRRRRSSVQLVVLFVGVRMKKESPEVFRK
jgi:hypothetical protein